MKTRKRRARVNISALRREIEDLRLLLIEARGRELLLLRERIKPGRKP